MDAVAQVSGPRGRNDNTKVSQRYRCVSCVPESPVDMHVPLVMPDVAGLMKGSSSVRLAGRLTHQHAFTLILLGWLVAYKGKSRHAVPPVL